MTCCSRDVAMLFRKLLQIVHCVCRLRRGLTLL